MSHTLNQLNSLPPRPLVPSVPTTEHTLFSVNQENPPPFPIHIHLFNIYQPSPWKVSYRPVDPPGPTLPLHDFVTVYGLEVGEEHFPEYSVYLQADRAIIAIHQPNGISHHHILRLPASIPLERSSAFIEHYPINPDLENEDLEESRPQHTYYDL